MVQCIPFGLQEIEFCQPHSPATITEVSIFIINFFDHSVMLKIKSCYLHIALILNLD